MSNTELEKLTFEEAMQELEKLVDSLDKGDVSLDEAIAAYDRGSQLKDYCQKKLHDAKMKVETIQASENIDTIPEKLSSFKTD
jgi:exodeoxyribonuclease VII small subunit